MSVISIMDNFEYTHLIAILILIIISSIVYYIIRILSSARKLNNKLISNDIYIITNDFCKCRNVKVCNLHIFDIKCSLCKIDRIIDFEKEKDVYKLLANINNKVKFIIHTEGGESDLPNFLTYILKQNDIYVETYIPQMALSAGSFIALSSNIINMNWYSSMGPIDTQIDYTICDSDNENYDESFPAKHIRTIKHKTNAFAKLKSLQADGYHNDDLYILDKIFKKKKKDLIIKHFLETDNSHCIRYGPKDLSQYGLNIKVGIPDNVTEIFNMFKKFL